MESRWRFAEKGLFDHDGTALTEIAWRQYGLAFKHSQILPLRELFRNTGGDCRASPPFFWP
jgi:hypothetical protein